MSLIFVRLTGITTRAPIIDVLTTVVVGHARQLGLPWAAFLDQ